MQVVAQVRAPSICAHEALPPFPAAPLAPTTTSSSSSSAMLSRAGPQALAQKTSFTEESETLLTVQNSSIKTLGVNLRPSWEQKGAREAKLSWFSRGRPCALRNKVWFSIRVLFYTRAHDPLWNVSSTNYRTVSEDVKISSPNAAFSIPLQIDRWYKALLLPPRLARTELDLPAMSVL